jgi:hypothetical protein
MSLEKFDYNMDFFSLSCEKFSVKIPPNKNKILQSKKVALPSTYNDCNSVQLVGLDSLKF